MMDYVNGWMHGSMGGGIGALPGVLVVVLLVIEIVNQSKKLICVYDTPVRRVVIHSDSILET